MRRYASIGPAKSRPRGARISEADRALWDAVLKEVTPLRPDTAAPAAEAHKVTPPERLAPEIAGPIPVMAPPSDARGARVVEALVIGKRAAGMDNFGWASLTQKRAVPAHRTLDLHGRTVQSAYLALHDFLERAWSDGVRHVEIITGRGSGTEGGAIRRELPHWLNAPGLRRLLLGAAHPHPRNPGSVRLLLRRRKG